MIQTGDKCIYIGETKLMKKEDGESVLICNGDRVTILYNAYLNSTNYVYVSVKNVNYPWLIDLKHLILVEEFPQDCVMGALLVTGDIDAFI